MDNRASPVSPVGTVHRLGKKITRGSFRGMWKTECGRLIDERDGWGWRRDATAVCKVCIYDPHERDDLLAVEEMQVVIHDELAKAESDDPIEEVSDVDA